MYVCKNDEHRLTKVEDMGEHKVISSQSMTQLRSVQCHMGSHSVTCYPTQVNAPHLHPSQTDWYSSDNIM